MIKLKHKTKLTIDPLFGSKSIVIAEIVSIEKNLKKQTVLAKGNFILEENGIEQPFRTINYELPFSEFDNLFKNVPNAGTTQTEKEVLFLKTILPTMISDISKNGWNTKKEDWILI